MSRHHLDVAVASDLSYECLQLTNRLKQQHPAAFDNTLGTLKVVTGYPVRKFIADPDLDDPGDGANPRARK